MPEGHTIHRAARLQNELLRGSAVHADSPQGRFADGAALLDGRVLERVEAFGKHLFYVFEGDVRMHVHLGLFGKFRYGATAQPRRETTRLRMWSERGWVHLSGPTACEIIDAAMRRAILARIGPDPLRADARPAAAIARIGRSSVAIGALLMDQSVIGGIGNVYRAELLYRARLSPFAAGRTIERAALMNLWRDARKLLRAGEIDGRIVTTLPHDRPHPRGAARSGERYYVYHRTGKACRVCGTTIACAPMAARTVYWCPYCQPP